MTSNILMLTYPNDPYAAEDAICHYAAFNGGGSLVVTTIGGAAFSFVDQCAGAAYTLRDNGNNPATPFCRPFNATSAIAMATSVVGT